MGARVCAFALVDADLSRSSLSFGFGGPFPWALAWTPSTSTGPAPGGLSCPRLPSTVDGPAPSSPAPGASSCHSLSPFAGHSNALRPRSTHLWQTCSMLHWPLHDSFSLLCL